MMETSEALGGSRQDTGVEGDIAAIMNIAYYLEFLDWRAGVGEAAERAAGAATQEEYHQQQCKEQQKEQKER